MQIKDHRLKNGNVKFVPTKKHGIKFGINLPDTIIVHYTATRSVEAAVDTLAKSEKKASAHLVVGKNDEIVQIVDFDTIAWHAGISEYKGRKGFNKYSIGIEIDNPGWLKRTGNRFTTWYEKEVDISDVVEARHRNPETDERFWHRYTEKQIEVVEEICETLASTYDIKHILGHEEISPGRKQDPGPAFPLDKIRNNILAADRDQEEGAKDEFPIDGVVNVNNSLNIRALPFAGAEKVARPIRNKQKVTIIEEENGWYRVRTEITGWVSKKYIKKQNS